MKTDTLYTNTNELRCIQNEELEEGYRKKWYPDKASQTAFLLGGIGTGNISLGSRGQLMDWEIFNRPGKGMNLPYSFFAIRLSKGGSKPICRILESKLQPPYTQGLGHLSQDLGGLPRFAHARLSAEYPFAEVELIDKKVPAKVSFIAFTPFIPLDADASGLPCAIFHYKVQNTSTKTISVSIAASLCNATDFKGYDIHRGLILGNKVRNTFKEEEGLSGLFFDNLESENKVLCQNSMALTTLNNSATSKPTWLYEGWFDGIENFWQEFSNHGKLTPCTYKENLGSKINIETYKVGSLCVSETLVPGEEKTFSFALSWYFPYRVRSWYDCDVPTLENSIKNHYAVLYHDAWDVLQYIKKHLFSLTEKSQLFTQALYSSTLPGYVIEAVANNLTVLRSSTCFRIENGTFLAWEGCARLEGSCTGTCTHVWNYAQSVAFLFPQLEQTARKAEFLLETDNEGQMNFRTHQVFDQPAWHLLPAADGQPGTIVRLYREWKLTGDDQFLFSVWDKAKKAMDFILSHWDSDDDGVLSGEQHNTYDIEFYGVTSLTNSLFYAALKASVQMATYVGDSEAASRYDIIFKKGSARMDALLWNGEYYRQDINDINAYKYQYGNGCLSDQLFGQFLAHVTGLGYVLPSEHVRNALKAIFKYNFCQDFSDHVNTQRTFAFNDEKGLLICTWPHGGRPELPFVYSDEVWTGIEYQVAAHMIYEGLLNEGLTLVKAIQNRQDGYKRNPYNENECGNHYSRSMASWALLTALSGFQFDMGKGEVSFAPCMSQDNFSTFFSTGKAWGLYKQIKNEDGILEKKLNVLYGNISDVQLTESV